MNLANVSAMEYRKDIGKRIIIMVSKYISILAVSVFVLSVSAVAPVSAITDEQSGNTDDRSSSNKRVAQQNTTSEGAEVSTMSQQSVNAKELREKAQKLLETERQNKKLKSLEARQKACEARKASIMTRAENYERNADKHLGVFDKIYDKVLEFKETKNLDAENFTELKATVDAKKAAAETAIKALGDSSVEIDCTADDPATTVATLKTAVKTARAALHEYRVAIKDMVVALQSASDSEDASESTGGTN